MSYSACQIGSQVPISACRLGLHAVFSCAVARCLQSSADGMPWRAWKVHWPPACTLLSFGSEALWPLDGNRLVARRILWTVPW
jgi:hypothetical protein